jgi:glutamate synthase domain-containing protein 3
MSGGYAYVLDMEGDFAKRCNVSMVDLEPLAPESQDEANAKRLIENHQKYTNSKRASEILAAWPQYRAKFVKVFPKEYRRALAELAQKKVAA